MAQDDLKNINDDDYEVIGSFDYLRELFKISEKNALPYDDKEHSRTGKIVEKIMSEQKFHIILDDLLYHQNELDVISGSVYPGEYQEYSKFMDADVKNPLPDEEFDKKQFDFLDEKRFLLLLYKAFQQRENTDIEQILGEEKISSPEEFESTMIASRYVKLDITNEVIREAYKKGTRFNKIIDKAFRESIEGVTKGLDTSKINVFATGFMSQDSAFQAYSYKEIMNNKTMRRKFIELSDGAKDFLAKRMSPLDLDLITANPECGYRALFNLDVLSRNTEITEEDLHSGRFDWLASHEALEEYVVGRDSLVTEGLRKLLDDPTFTSYIDDRRFNMVALYRTLDFMDNQAINKTYTPDVLVNMAVTLLKNTYNSPKNEFNEQPLPIFKDFADDQLTHYKIIHLTQENLDRYFNDVLPEYINQVINKNPESFKRLVEQSAYRFNAEELACYIRLVDSNQEELLHKCYSFGDITAKELVNIINDNDDLSIERLIIGILKNAKTKEAVSNFADIVENGGIEPQKIAYLLKESFVNGDISIEDVNRYRNEIFSNIDGFDTSMLRSAPDKLARQFIILNKETLLQNLRDNEGFTDKDITEFLENYSYMATEYSKEDLEEIAKDYKYNRALFISNGLVNNESSVYEMSNELDTLMLSPSILKLLYDEQLINREKGIEYGGKDFKALIDGKKEEVKKVEEPKKVSIEHLEDLLKRTLKPSKKYSKYNAKDFIEQYEKFINEASDEEIRNLNREIGKYQSLLVENNNRFFKDSLITLGRRGILTKEFLAGLAEKDINYMDVIGALIADENTLSVDTLKYLFNDKFVPGANPEDKHRKRRLLEKLLSTRPFSQDDKFLILMSVYGCHDDKCPEIQKDFDSDNFQYFIDTNYLMLDEVNENTKKGAPSYSKGKKIKFGEKNEKGERIKYPLLDRHDTYYGIDNNVILTRAANAWVYVSHKYNRAAVETVGTKQKGVVKNDLTNHASYTMDLETFEAMKKYFIEEKDSERVLNFSNIISYFRANKDNPNLKRVCHSKAWKTKIRESFIPNQDDDSKKKSLQDE